MPVLPSYKNQSTDLLCKSVDWFLYDGNTGIYLNLTPIKFNSLMVRLLSTVFYAHTFKFAVTVYYFCYALNI